MRAAWRRGFAMVSGCTAVLVAVEVVAGSSVAAASDTPVLPRIPEQVDTADGCTPAGRQEVRRTPWAQQLLGVREAQRLGLGGGVTVGVVDTGVDTGAVALKGRVSGDGAKDCVGHGTFAAGLVAGARRDGVGFVGVAPQARVFGVRVTTAGGVTDADAVADGIDKAVRHGCEVVLVSVAYGKPSARMKAAVAGAVRRDVVVVAPVSGGRQYSAPAYPGALPGVVSVGSVGVDGAPYPSGRKALAAPPDLVAPGDRVMSVGPGGGHFTGDGDTVAAAFVAGAAALVRAHDPALTATAVADRLRATAAHPAGAVPDPLAGYGLTDPAAALSGVPVPAAVPAARATTPYRVPSRPASLSPGPAWAVAALAGLTALLAAALATIVPRGRARDWQPGNRT
ncbi:S8 family serine peptidase [Streptomyces sp. NPDC002920]